VRLERITTMHLASPPSSQSQTMRVDQLNQFSTTQATNPLWITPLLWYWRVARCDRWQAQACSAGWSTQHSHSKAQLTAATSQSLLG